MLAQQPRQNRFAAHPGVRVPQLSATSVQVVHLADHSEVVPILGAWLESEWPDWYGPDGPGDVQVDLVSYSNRNRLPIGLVAFDNGELCGFAALKSDTISGYGNLEPWGGAVFVPPRLRNHGIGSELIQALEQKAVVLGYETIYAGTSGAVNLLRRCGWRELGQVSQNGDNVHVFEKAL